VFVAIQLLISEPTRATQYELIVVNSQITTFAFHEVVIWVVSSWCGMQKILKVGQCFTELFKN